MRILIISDIHANITALESVIESAGQFDSVWCLGDLVGYGPDPNECIERIENLDNLRCIIGNHDLAALKELDSNSFNPEARSSIHWTRETLTENSRKFLRNLKEKIILDPVTLTHGSPRHPVWEYVLDPTTASLNFDFFTTPFCFVGHTHLPAVYSLNEAHQSATFSIPEINGAFQIPVRSILNPGSVGQPRDRDPRSSYAIYDQESNSWEYQRVDYDIRSVQSRMRSAGLPERHIIRLEAGW